MPRKKKPSPHPKRIQVTDSDGWTHIRRSHSKTTSNKHACCSSSLKKLLPSSIPTGQTLLDLRNTHAHYRSQWLPSPCHLALQDLLRNDLPLFFFFSSSRCIDRCIILGLGSLSNGRRSSWWELVFLETLLESLFLHPSSHHHRKTPDRKLEETAIYAQDPVFNELDRVFLEDLGYTVVSDPAAFDLITASTLLFAPHLEVEVYAKALGKAKPRMCIGTAMEECLERVINNNHEREMEEENEIFSQYLSSATTVSSSSTRLPDFDRDPWTQFTCLYWINNPVKEEEEERGESDK
ncbi:MAG: hypothetical protein LQ341_003854 [Variospora aurantia]|nr:MAG: hypothetical protein LQ341_003854 [Variospora aurantia]